MSKISEENIKAIGYGISFLQASILAERAYGDKYGTEGYSDFANDPIKYKKEHTELYVFPLKNRKVVLAFQGSNGLLDWLDDLNCFFTSKKSSHYSDKKIKISDGFDSNYEPIRKTVFDIIDQYGIQNIIFTGHSLGAANARFEMSNKFGVDIPTIVFGEPNGGNRAYYDVVGTEKYWSIRNNRDIVCKVPFLSFGYAKPNRLQIDGGKSKDHWKWSFIFKCIGNPDDHYPELYVNGCRNIVE
jgi:hypothetical protein